MRPPVTLDILPLVIIVSVVVIAGIVTLVYFILRPQKTGEQKNRRYLEIAKERYAKGEVSKKEFEQLKKDLS